MPAFDELLSGISPETGYPDDFLDMARGAYDGDMSSANAVIADLEAKLSAATAALNEEKIVNYELMRASAATVEPDGDPDPDPETTDEDSDNPQSFDDLNKED